MEAFRFAQCLQCHIQKQHGISSTFDGVRVSVANAAFFQNLTISSTSNTSIAHGERPKISAIIDWFKKLFDAWRESDWKSLHEIIQKGLFGHAQTQQHSSFSDLMGQFCGIDEYGYSSLFVFPQSGTNTFIVPPDSESEEDNILPDPMEANQDGGDDEKSDNTPTLCESKSKFISVTIQLPAGVWKRMFAKC